MSDLGALTTTRKRERQPPDSGERHGLPDPGTGSPAPNRLSAGVSCIRRPGAAYAEHVGRRNLTFSPRNGTRILFEML